MKISVALATYNGEKYIRKQLESIHAQALKPDELVISDDRSTDSTVTIINEFAQTTDIRTKLFINQANIGFRDNFYNAIRSCEGDVIALCDQDDIWHPDKLRTCVKALNDASIDAVVHGYNLIDDNSKIVKVISPARHNKIREALEGNPWACWPGFSLVFRKRAIAAADYEMRPVDWNFPSDRMAHDQWVSFLLFNYGRVALIRNALVDYRQHSMNVIGYRQPEKWRSLSQLLQIDLGRQRFLIHVTKSIQQYLQEYCRDAAHDSRSISYWRKQRLLHHLRYKIYLNKNRYQRLKCFLSALVRGLYRSRAHGGLGVLAFMKDIINLAVLTSPKPER